MHRGAFAETTPDKAAVVMDDGRTLTYAELDAASNRLAHLLRAAGLTVGDHIAFVLENRPEVFVVAWAAQRAGLYYTACSTRLGVDELQYIVNDCGARVLVASASTLGTASQVEAPAVQLRLAVDGEAEGWKPLDAALAAQPTTPVDDEAEGSDMLYSSGTTGRPKGVKPPLPEGPFPQMSAIGTLAIALFGMEQDSVYLSPAPLYHAAPLRFSMAVHRVGATVVVMERFDPEAFLALVERHRVTFTQVVPTMFLRLLKLPDEVRGRYDVSSLSAVVHAAAPCPVEAKERMIAWWGPIIHEYYAGTEGNGFVYCTSEQWMAHKGTVGTSLLGPAHILDEDGAEVPVGRTGTVYFEAGGFEYHHDPEKTAGSRDPKGRGWTTLGDVGYLDEEGYLYLTDRKAYMIISGGVNIYPQEAENALALHPKVADVAVFGIPDDEMGEAVHAVVQPADGVAATDALARELIAYCRDRLAHYKCPRTVAFRPELPRHPTGKLYKRLLRDEYWSTAPTPGP
ncbi:MAG TPA: acyl-CoA synthetase [Acidimicrobiales bacterium]|nr:acyl-CoA synthetase [Acidimicrobiales bacterium]